MFDLLIFSLLSEGFDRIELCGLRGWVDAEDDSCQAGDAEGEDDGPRSDDRFHFGEMRDNIWNNDAKDDADDSSSNREDDGLDKELGDDVFSLRAESAADADLAGALSDGGEHDVHNADSSDEE